MASALTAVLFPRLPVSPNKGKWTKTGQSTDWFVFALNIMNTLQQLWPLAWRSLRVMINKFKNGDMAIQEVNFHATAGARVKHGDKLIKQVDAPEQIMILGILLEPFRYITGWFMKATAVNPDAAKRPPLCSVVTACFSPVIKASQYFSMLLRGVAPRLKLVWMRRGYTNFWEWCEAQKDLLTQFRIGIQVGSTWMWRRLWFLVATWPWLAAACIDDRLTIEQRTEIDDAFASAPLWQLDWYMMQRWRVLGRRLMAALEQATLRAWAFGVRLSTAQIEFSHGRNQRRGTEAMSWAHFAAQAVTQEAQLALEHTDSLAVGQPTADTGRHAKPVTTRKRTARDEF